MEEDEPEAKKFGWLAYTPPPVSMSLSYEPERKWNHWKTDWTNGAFLMAIILDRQHWLGQDEVSEDRWGSLSDQYDGGEIRGFRLGAVGSLNFETPWIYTVFWATSAFDKGFETNPGGDM